MRVALVHDYLFDYGGAERVLEVLHEIWPKAPVYTAWVDWGWLNKNKPEWEEWEIRPSWFQNIPFKRKLTSPLRFLAKAVWESFDLKEFDVVISSAAWFITKGVITRAETLHVCYCHTPPRYLYGLPTARDWKRSWLTRTYAVVVNPFLRHYDFLAAQKVDKFVTNSENTRRRIQKFYRRDARVIYPPVAMQPKLPITNYQLPNGYFLMVNRLVGMKRVDVAVKAAKKNGVSLKILGTGIDEGRLKRMAGDAENIEFLGYVSDEKLGELYAGCLAVVYLADEEDFGITPVEAMMHGKPVIAVNSGGVKESVVDGETGILLKNLSVEKLVEVLKKFKAQSSKFKVDDIKTQAKKFSKGRFMKEMKEFVEKEYKVLKKKDR